MLPDSWDPDAQGENCWLKVLFSNDSQLAQGLEKICMKTVKRKKQKGEIETEKESQYRLSISVKGRRHHREILSFYYLSTFSKAA